MDAPIFDAAAFRLTGAEAALATRARDFGAAVLAPRAARWDREASFPTENYRDMAANGLLGICIPAVDGGLGAGFRAYCLAAAEMGGYCGATALTWNMHVCSTLWTGALVDDLDMPPEVRVEQRRRRSLHYGRMRGGLYKPRKAAITIRLDADVLAWFRAQAADGATDGRGYQSEINRVLRQHIAAPLGGATRS